METLNDLRAVLDERFAAPLGIRAYHLALYERDRRRAVSILRPQDAPAGSLLDHALAAADALEGFSPEVLSSHFGAGAVIQTVGEGMAGILLVDGPVPGEGAAVTEPAAVDALCRMAIVLGADAHLREQLKNENEQIILSVGEGILAVDSNRRVVFMNPVAMELLGLADIRPAGRLLQELVPVLPLERYWNELNVQGRGAAYEELAFDAGGTARDLGISLMKLADLAGQPAGLILSLRDLRAEKDVERMREEFLTTVSHEFRTPLTSIKSFSEMLLMYDDEDQETRKEFLGIINRESDTLHRLVEDALAISRLEGGSVEWRPVPLNLEELLREQAEELQPGFGERNLTLAVRWNAGAVELNADRTELGRALGKLLDNCRKFAPEGSEVSVAAERDGADCVIRFANGGEEIPERNRELIFQKFKQGDDFMHNKADGTGLGLPICRKVVEHHGGTVVLEQGSAGRTVFAVRLPVPDTL